VLLQEIRAQGFGGSYAAICRALKRFRPGDGRRLPPTAVVQPKPRPLSAHQAMWLLVRTDDQLTDLERRRRAALYAAHPAIATAAGLAQRFGRLLRERAVADLDPWLNDALGSGIAEFREFARSLRRDYAAVIAALRLPYSNAQLEGQVNRLKLVKRMAVRRVTRDAIAPAGSQE
jgi:transposase